MTTEHINQAGLFQ